MYTDISQVTVESLRRETTLIHYFGLGFIQVKLGETHRLHFYTAELPAIIDDEDVHDHRYDFESRMLFGFLDQEIFRVTEGSTHVLEEESCREGVEAGSKPKPCGISLLTSQHFAQGSSYRISHEAFHRVHAASAITCLTRGPVVKQNARIIRTVGAAKVCPFSKKVAEADLWRIVERMLAEAHGS